MSKFDLRLLPSISLTQVNTDTGRYYTLPDCDIKFTSVTTFLGKTSDDSFLEKWKKRVGEENAKVISERALDRGNTIHSYLESYLLGRPYKATKFALQFDCIKKYLNRNLTTILGIENRLYSKEMELAGTTDLIGIYKDKVSIIDFKGSNKEKKIEWIEGYFLQCLIYAKMVKELFDIEIEQIVVLIGVDKAYKAQEFIVESSDFDKYEKLLKERFEIWENLKLK